MRRGIVICLLCVGLVIVPTQKSQAVWWWVVKAAVKKAIKAADLAIQKQQNKVIWLQNAQKTIENAMAKLKLDEISDWTEKQREIYKKYFDELHKVKVLITYYQRIKDITQRQLQIVAQYKQAWQFIRQDKNFTPEEVVYMGRVYDGIIRETLENINQLSLVVNSFQTQMSDAKRIEIIALVDRKVQENYSDLLRFNTENAMLSLKRAKDFHEVEMVKRMYGLK